MAYTLLGKLDSIAAGMSTIESVASDYDDDFIYRVGETVSVDNFDDDRWNECSYGIHCFISKHDAEIWEG